MSESWYVLGEGSEAVGPVTTDLLIRGLKSGKVPTSSRVCAVGASAWVPIATHPSFANAVRAAAPPPPREAEHPAAPPPLPMTEQEQPYRRQIVDLGGGQQMQPYHQQAIEPARSQQINPFAPPPNYWAPPPGYSPPAPQPINIVVTNTATSGGGGLVRVGNKSRGTAAILALVFGGFGAHKFYLGQPIMGLLYLCFCWTFLPALAGFIEAFGLLFTSDHAFDMKYNARLT